jgi:hypothetical protein
MSPISSTLANGSAYGYRTFAAAAANSYESIATVTAAGGETSMSFTSIPSTYKHLEIRGIARDTIADNSAANLKVRLNSDTGSNYTRHALIGDGTNAYALAGTAQDNITLIAGSMGDSSTASAFGASIISIQDYASTTKYKTIRGFSGSEASTASTNFYVVLNSGLWLDTTAITSIQMLPGQTAFKAGSTFALYGIKGA